LRLFLDTNVLLWWRNGSPRLPDHVNERIRDPDNEIMVSIVSLWEIAIKRALGKLRFSDDFEEVIEAEDFHLLTLTYQHLRLLGDLPPHHRDPFDRMLIAQALAERMPIVTADRAFTPYDVNVVWQARGPARRASLVASPIH
jgi:PIN domain nuclease of toxin-antitoxin system